MIEAKLEIVQVDPRGDLARRLLDRYYGELRDRFPHGFETGEAAAKQLGDFEGPSGTFLVVFVNVAAIACGAMRRLDQDTAELKRMWVDPEARGRGVGRSLLEALESASREAGYGKLCLDTSAHLPEAVALYRSAGFDEIPDYNANADAAFWFGKSLT